MNFLKLSLMNLRQNLKNYGMYIFSMVFSVLVFYNFTTLIFSDQFIEINNLSIISTIAGLCTIVLFIFFIFFISYSSSFFIEQRKKEFGIYTFMGVENNKIALLFAQEGLFTGILSLLGGIFGGIAINKLFLMSIVKMSNIDTSMKFEISKESVVITSIMFLGILLLVFIKEYLILVKTDITKLINATNIYQNTNTKYKTFQGILGLLIVLFAYILIIYYKDFSIEFPLAIGVTVISVIIGTILMFNGFFTFVMSKIINNKKLLYKNTNILSYNNIIFRINDNNKTLGQVAILITCCLTSIIVATSMKSLFTDAYGLEVPYSLYYISKSDNDDKLVDKAIKLSKETIDYKIDANLIPYNANLHTYVRDVNIVRYSDIENIMENKDIDNEKKIIKNKPNSGEGIVIIPKNMINGFNLKLNVNIVGKEIKVKEKIASPMFGNLVNEALLIVNDNDYDYFMKNIKDLQIIKYRGIALKDFDNTAEISSYVNKNSDIQIFASDMFDQSQYDFINSVYFIGLFLALVFMVSVGSIMYFKCISDASKDKVRFETLRKIGTSQEYINKAIYKQIGIFFSLPILIGTIHSIIAGYAVSNLFNQEGYSAILMSVGGFFILYLAYYIITAKKYIGLTK